MFLSILLISGCASIKTIKTTELVSNAKLLIMPPHDVVQGGMPHAAGKGSGRLLLKATLKNCLFSQTQRYGQNLILRIFTYMLAVKL